MTINIHYLRILSSGYNNKVYVGTQEEDIVYKLFQRGDKKAQEEFISLEKAYGLNPDLFPFPLYTGFTSDYQFEAIAMRRFYPLQKRALTYEQREDMFMVFRSKVKLLHENGFIHGDIKRPVYTCRNEAEKWDNLILTHDGIKMIDVGQSCFKDDTTMAIEWEKQCQNEITDLKEYRDWLLK